MNSPANSLFHLFQIYQDPTKYWGRGVENVEETAQGICNPEIYSVVGLRKEVRWGTSNNHNTKTVIII